MDESVDITRRALSELFLSKSMFQNYDVRSAVDLLNQQPALAAERFHCCWTKGERLFPLTALLIYSRRDIEASDVQRVYEMYPAVCRCKVEHMDGALPLHVSVPRCSPDVIAFLAKAYPPALKVTTEKDNALPIHYLMDRFIRKNVRETSLIQLFLDLAPNTLLQRGGARKQHLLNRAIEKKLRDWIADNLLNRIPVGSSLFQELKRYCPGHESVMMDLGCANALSVVLPKLKQLNLFCDFWIPFGTRIFLEKLLDNQSIDAIGVGNIYADDVGLWTDFIISKLRQGRLKVFHIVVSKSAFSSMDFENILGILQSENAVTHLKFVIEGTITQPVLNSEKQDLLSKIKHFSYMNKHGRAKAQNPQTPLLEFINHLGCLNKDTEEGIDEYKDSLRFCLLSEAPSIWAAGMGSNNMTGSASSAQKGKKKRTYQTISD